MKILFVDHAFHRKTNSSGFFRELLRTCAEVVEIYVDPQTPTSALNLELAGFDLVAVWQMDFLAPLFLARGMRTVVVPMFDGSGAMPDLHWQWSNQARFVNFSRRLHHRISALGGSSFLLRYYKPPAPERHLPDFTQLRGFFWRRAPETGINLALVKQLLGASLDTLHVHDAPDNPDLDMREDFSIALPKISVTRSTWFEDPAEYERRLSAANVFIAPRPAEGIGMAMLEAMSRGMVVIAADQGVHDEYIANWVNGVLFNLHAPGAVTLTADNAAALGRAAWHSVALGYDAYQAQIPRLFEFLNGTPAPKPLAFDSQIMGERLIRAYLSGVEGYSAFLENNRQLAGLRVSANIRAGSGAPLNSPRHPWLDQNRLDARGLASGKHVLSGKISEIAGTAWLRGESLRIGFRLDHRVAATSQLRLHIRRPVNVPPRSYCFVLNGQPLAIGELTEERAVLEIEINAAIAQLDNELLVLAKSADFAPELNQVVSLGVERLEFV
jgi:hypothetical protein